MPNTYKKIASVTVGSGGAASIDFTSIPQTYTDLKIVLSGRSLQGNVYGGGKLEFNSSTSNYSWRRLRGDGSAAASDNSTSATSITNWDMNGANATASVFSNIEFYIPNYTSSNYKSVSVEYVGENNATEAHMGMVAGLWSDTSAITSIKLSSAGGNLVQHTTATLYGIGDVTASKFAKAVGGVITYDANYVYHTYPYSGNFTPNTALTVDYLVVAGGGGGGYSNTNGTGGGGGAGGLRCTVGATGGGGSLESQLSLSSGSAYTVTVGAGGALSSPGNRGLAGSNSVFATITSTGGGGGGGQSQATGGTGGSGGGGHGANANAGGSGTANQGYAGGTSGLGTPGGSGGGGAGAVGGSGTNLLLSGNGGNGVTTTISGTSTTYAGGGGGNGDTKGNGGTGGGGNGQATVAPTSPATSGGTNTGGGGGGYYNSGTAAGGSGIVIIRYPR